MLNGEVASRYNFRSHREKPRWTYEGGERGLRISGLTCVKDRISQHSRRNCVQSEMLCIVESMSEKKNVVHLLTLPR